MIPEVKNIDSPDVSSLRTYCPPEGGVFSFIIEVSIGLPGSEAADLFTFTVCTPQWLFETYKFEKPIMLIHTILINSFSFEQLEAALIKMVRSCSGESWDEIANKIGRYGHWEYANYSR